MKLVGVDKYLSCEIAGEKWNKNVIERIRGGPNRKGRKSSGEEGREGPN